MKHFSGSVLPPIYQQSSYIFDSLEDLENAKYNYGRRGTETNRILEHKINQLESARQSWVCPSGASAIYLPLFALVEKGDHILVCETAYGPTQTFCNQYLKKIGVEVSYFAGDISEEIEKLIQPNTSLIFLESPSSIFYQVQEIETIVNIAQSKNIYTVFDNTYSSSELFKPLDYGIDVSLLSASKYYSGHSDIIAGVVSAKDEKICQKINHMFGLLGYHTSPYDCYQIYKGLETMKIRIKHQQKSAKKMAQFLETRDEIGTLIYPTLKSFAQKKRFNQYFKGANSLISFSLKDKYSYQQNRDFVNALQCFGIGYSWGGCESMVMLYDGKFTRPKNYDVNQNFIRISLGLENIKTLIEDITQALEKINS